MITLVQSLSAWLSDDFDQVFKDEVQRLDKSVLPLQQGLSQSSHVVDSPLQVVVLGSQETPDHIQVKAGIFYAGVVAGSCCSDDPTPLCEQPEYCEVQFDIDKTDASTSVSLL